MEKCRVKKRAKYEREKQRGSVRVRKSWENLKKYITGHRVRR